MKPSLEIWRDERAVKFRWGPLKVYLGPLYSTLNDGDKPDAWAFEVSWDVA